ncbi:hypothetical protein IKE98_03915 [Candidatus Saccharibacteria bacterium]|nr:hypothetical protein [Candidatus Saccharibacteria bacterium]
MDSGKDSSSVKSTKESPVSADELAAAFEGPKQEQGESIDGAKNNDDEISDKTPIIGSEPTSKKSHKVAIVSAVCVAAIIGGVVLITSNSNTSEEYDPSEVMAGLTDEQKEKFGLSTEKEEAGDHSEIEDENNYSEEYKKYLELSDEEKAELEVIPRKEVVPDDAIEEIKEDTDKGVVTSLPDKFDLRDVIDITVGNQGEYGLCWDYASNTSLETHLKLRGIDYNPSELQIDFLSSDLLYGGVGDTLHQGGSFQRFADIAASIGTISEDKFASFGINLDSFSHRGSDANLDYFQLAKNDTPLYVTKTVDFPSVYKVSGVVDGKTDEEMKEFRDLVKAHIVANGSLYASTTGPWWQETPRYCEKSMDGCWANHAMSIIGWDDNYPKENFAKVDERGVVVEGTPVHDGAYLVLNSWGEGWNGSGAKNGVFYISYDEYDIEASLSGIISTSLDNAKKIDSIASKTARDLIREKLSFYIIEENGEEYISDYALDRVSYLDLSSRGLTDSDLESITETFSSLSSLNIANNNISDLSPLANLDNLNGVYFSKNNVEDISVLCSMDNVKLNSIDLSYNRVADVSCLENKLDDYYPLIDVSGNVGVKGLEKLTNLDGLVADEIGLESLEPLSSLNKLRILSVRNNNIKSLEGLETEGMVDDLDLSGNKGLTDLSFDKPVYDLRIMDSGLTDVSILNNIKAANVHASGNSFGDLSYLNADGIAYLDLSGSKNLSNLSSLNTVGRLVLSNCGIKSLSEIGGLSGVKSLTLNNNEIESLEGIEGLSGLTFLNVADNKLSSLDGIDRLEELTSLDVTNNSISSLSGLAKLSKLDVFLADNNMITDAKELTNIKNLHFLSLSNNRLSLIPNFQIQSYFYLVLDNNPIKNATIPNAANAISLAGCGAETIDYSNVGNLADITLDGNPDWNEYSNLTYRSLLGQRNLNLAFPRFEISTDYNFSKKELDDLDSIPGLFGYDRWYIRLKEYTNELTKSPDGTIDLENYPNERAMFMSLLKTGSSTDGFKVDKAATKLTLADSSSESLSLEQQIRLNNNLHISANKATLKFR